MKKIGFTLAEIMIVLSVIAVLTAILLPAARNAMPNENIIKFKKAHNTFYSAINELVTSDKYYLNGDLGVRSDGSLVDSATYFCETIADVVNVKKVNCSNYKSEGNPYHSSTFTSARLDYADYLGVTLEQTKDGADMVCKENVLAGSEIILKNNIVFYQTNPGYHFGTIWYDDQVEGSKLEDNIRTFGDHLDLSTTFDRIYKPFCIDIDGIGQGEDPFGYGIRADGKILNGTRADEWLEKSIQEK